MVGMVIHMREIFYFVHGDDGRNSNSHKDWEDGSFYIDGKNVDSHKDGRINIDHLGKNRIYDHAHMNHSKDIFSI